MSRHHHSTSFWGAGIILAWFLGALADAIVISLRTAVRSPRRPYQRWWAYVALFALGVVANNAAALFLRAFWLEAFVIPTGSMADTLLPGDRLIADHTWYLWNDLRHGDIVIHGRTIRST